MEVIEEDEKMDKDGIGMGDSEDELKKVEDEEEEEIVVNEDMMILQNRPPIDLFESIFNNDEDMEEAV